MNPQHDYKVLGPRKKLPATQLVAYGAGSAATNLLDWGIGAFMPIFNLVLGLSPVLVGLAFSLPRLVDFITDPLAGYLSDSLSRWFNRGFFVILGGTIGALFFIALYFFPLGLSPTAYFMWIVVFLSAAFGGVVVHLGSAASAGVRDD